MDADGDLDVLGAAYDAQEIAWWENDGSEAFTKHTIEQDCEWVWSAYAVDVDSDGDLDILGIAAKGDEITWWENDGAENFRKHTVKGSAS